MSMKAVYALTLSTMFGSPAVLITGAFVLQGFKGCMEAPHNNTTDVGGLYCPDI